MHVYDIPAEIRASKAELLEILSTQAIAFVDWLNDPNDIDAVRIKTMVSMVEYVNVGSPLFTDYVIPLLYSKGIITDTTLERIDSFKQFKTTHRF